jgi:dTDP-4-amino-4,6-dideoxygalactose transaminase
MAQHTILLNDFKRQWADTRADVLAAVEATGESGWYILGAEVAAFESSLAALFGTTHAIAVASGLDALQISLQATGCTAGTRVLTSPVSAFATVLAIVKSGGIPVFVDCDASGLVDLDLCEEALRTNSDIKFFLPVHLYGQSLDLCRLDDLRENYGVTVIEDCAQAIGSSFNGIRAGSVGQCAATSFYPTKNLGALGDGGAILTDSDRYAQTARVLRDYGQTAKYRHDEIGFNSRLDEVHAAILRRAFLPRLSRWQQRRKEIAEKYRTGIRHEFIRPLDSPSGSDSCWHLFPVVVSGEGGKQSLAGHLRKHQVMSAEHYPIALVDQNVMRNVAHQLIGECRNAREICRSELSLPIHPYLGDSDVERVIEACNCW